MENSAVRSPVSIVVFSILSCGIYFVWWIYTFSTELKSFLNNNEINPGMETFLSLICFPYLVYWFYKAGKYVNSVRRKSGLNIDEDASLLPVILAVFGLAVVSAAVLQSTINEAWNSNPQINNDN